MTLTLDTCLDSYEVNAQILIAAPDDDEDDIDPDADGDEDEDDDDEDEDDEEGEDPPGWSD